MDIDYRNGGGAWEQANAHRLPQTRTHGTLHGGRHYVLRHAPGVRNSASHLAQGIDIRGDGGYACWPPSGGYSVVSDAPIADWPDWLLALVLARPVKDEERPAKIPISYAVAPGIPKRIERYVQALLERVSCGPRRR